MKAMYLLRIGVVSLFAFLSTSVFSQTWGIFQSYIVIDSGSGNEYRAGGENFDGANSAVGHYYGSFGSGDTFTLNGAEVKTFKNSGGNVCGGRLYYRVYKSCETPGSFNNTSDFAFVNEHPCCGAALPSSGDQRWDVLAENIDLLSGLTAGSYVLEFYWEIDGGPAPLGGCLNNEFDNNGGANYLAYFEYEMTDSFGDGDFTGSPTWTGDTGDFTVATDSDAAAGTTGSNTLRLDASAAGTSHLSTSFAGWDLNQEWSFFFGRRNQALTGSNEVEIWLYATEADLESATVDGYRLIAGDNSGDDEFILESVTDGVGTTVLTTTAELANGLEDYGIAFRVTRNGNGDWEVFTSTIPTADGEGVIATDCPLVDATISQGTATNTDYTPTGTGYFGLVAITSGGADARSAQELDQILIQGNDDGCDDNTACNYIAGSNGTVTCDFSCLGCTNSDALNFDPTATIDDGSCDFADLVITEIHYNSDDGGSFPDVDYEFVEIYNNESVAVDISGYTLTGFAGTFTFPASTLIAAGEYIVVAANSTSYSGNGYQVFDASGAGLSNGGETIELSAPGSTLIDTVSYDDSSPWPTAADGNGPSLELVDVNTDNDVGTNWQATDYNGTPGFAPGPVLGCIDPSATNYNISANTDDGSCTFGAATVTITELHYNPCTDQGNDGDFEFLELYNASASAIDISDWEILGFEFTFPASSSIAAGEYIVIVTNGGASNYTGSYQVFELTAVGASMANTGESVALLDDLGDYVDYVNYSPSSPWPTGADGNCSTLELTNTGSPNNDPTNWQDSNTFGGTPGAPNSTAFECVECGQAGSASATDLDEDWESGTLGSWTESTAGDWTADNTSPINGTYSLNHNLTTGSGTSHITNDLGCLYYESICTTWQFQIQNGTWDPSATDRFLIYLGANEADLQSGTVDGYAVGINYDGTDDFIGLYYMVDGAVSSTIMESNIDIDADNTLGVEVIRDPSGSWMLRLDVNGGFDDLFNVAASSASETSLSEGNYFGVLFDYTASSVGAFQVDDITISQCGDGQTYYSIATGNSSGAIWNTNPLGVTGETVAFGRFVNLVVQDGTTVTLDGSIVAGDLSTEATGTLEGASSAYTITLFGDLTNDGTYNAGDSDIIFKSGAAQAIGGSAGFDLYDLTIENGDTVTLNNQVSMINHLTMNMGVLDANSNLTIFSDASTTAYIAPMENNGEIIGDATFISFLEGGGIPANDFFTNPPGWTFVAPATSGLTIQDWDDDIITTGMTGSDNPLTAFVNIVSYDETQPGTTNNGYVFASNVTDVLDENLGYWLYEFTSDISLDVTGPVRQGSITIDLSHTNNEGTVADGWNLVNNVYAAPVDIEALVSNSDPDPSSGTQTAMDYYIFDTSAGSYVIYQAVTGTGAGSRYLAPHQAFFTRIDATHFDLQFDESVKDISQTGLNVVRDDMVIPTLTVSLSDDYYTTDQAHLVFHEVGDHDSDIFDAAKFYDLEAQNCAVSFMRADGQEMAIDSRPHNFDQNLEVPVYVHSTAAYSYTFKVEEMEDLPEGLCWSVENLITGEEYPVDEGTEIQVELEEAFEGVALVIHMRKAAIIESADISCNGLSDGNIIAEANGEGEYSFSWTDENDNFILSTTGTSSELSGLEFGTYFLTVNGGDLACENVITPVVISEPEPESYELLSDIAECDLEESARIELLPEEDNEYSYELYLDGELFLSETQAMGHSIIESLNPGNYELVLISACTSDNYSFDLRDPEAVSAAFELEGENMQEVEGGILVTFNNGSNNADSYLWSLGDGTQVYTDAPQHIYSEAGTYTVSLEAMNEFCSDLIVQDIEVELSTVGLEEASGSQFWIARDAEAINLHFNGINGLLTIEVYDMTGKLIKTEQIQGENAVYNLNTDNFSQGIYSIRLMTSSEVLYQTNFNK